MATGQHADGALQVARPSVWDGLVRALSPVEARPVMVDTLEAAQHTTGGVPYVMLRNTRAQTYLKLDPREYDLLALMDGTRSVKALVIEYFRRNGVLSLPRVAGLVELLRTHHFLVEPPRDVYLELGRLLHAREARFSLGRLVRGFLETAVAVPGVDGWLGRLYRAWGWLLFTWPLVVPALLVGVLGPPLFVLELSRGRYDVLRPEGSYLLGAVLFFGLELVVLAIHELGHGLAVKHAGRFVPRAGVMLYYGLPAAFVETTDIWMAPRRLRLVTSFAGPATGLVIGGLCALVAFLLPAGALGAFVFVFGFVSLLNTVLNFNPLLELDGYYLLVDLIEKPLLRARALAFVRGPLWAKLRKRQPLTGEERFFALFGLGSAAYSAVALLLALRFWERQILPVLRELWDSDQPVVRAIAVLVVVLLGSGLVLGLVSLARWMLGRARPGVRRLRGRAEAYRHREALAALRAVPIWAQLPEPQLLEIARALRVEEVPSGTEVVRQGDLGDRFSVIDSGTFEVHVDGRPVRQLGRGDYFGERALLEKIPRTATVLALEDSRLWSLGRDDFEALLAHDLRTRARLEAAVAYREEVAAMPLFQELGPAELDLLLSRLVPVSARAGEEIVRQGESGDRFYVIRSGLAEAMQDGEVLRRMGPGETFGEIALLLEVPRTATVRAVEDSELLALSAADFHDLLARYCGRHEELHRLSHLRLGGHKRLDQVVAGE